MSYAGSILGLINLFFAIVIGLYFWNLLRAQQGTKIAVDREAKKELEKLGRLRAISLTEPLAEKTRPASFEEIIGQEDGLKALRAALCGPNPQHLLLYGPPGVGKPPPPVWFGRLNKPAVAAEKHGQIYRVDATTARLIAGYRSVDRFGPRPITRAGPLGMAGSPARAGAVTEVTRHSLH